MSNTTMMWLWIAGFVLISIIVMHNIIIGRMNRAKRAWADVITYEKLKNDVIPELTRLASDYEQFESDLVQKVTSMREAISGLDDNVIDVDALKRVEDLSKRVFTSIKSTAESYPELGSMNVVRDLMAQVADKNENVAAAITIYNRGVEEFNNAIEMVPLNLVNGAFSRKVKLDTFTQSGTVESYDYKPNFS